MIKEALEAFAKSSERVWNGDRQQTVGASEIGRCARQTYFAKSEGDTTYGRERDPEHAERWGATLRGATYEKHVWEPALRAAYGKRLVLAGADQCTFEIGFLSATPDGLIVHDRGDPSREGGSTVVEAKSIDPRTNIAKPKAEHVYQLQVQIGLIRERTPYKPLDGVISYTDASFFDEVREFTIPFDPAVYDEARERAARIMLARSGDELPPEGIVAGGKECLSCPWTTACGRLRANRVPGDGNGAADYDPAEIALLEQEVAKAKVYAEKAGEFEQQERDAKEAIRAILQRLGTKRVKTPDWSVVWSALKGRPAWDMPGIRAAAEAAGVDLAPYAKEGEPSDRIQITVKS